MAECRATFNLRLAEIEKLVVDAIRQTASCADEVEDETRYAAETIDAVQTQLAWLVFPGFARFVPYARLQQYPRYFKGLSVRLERARVSPSGDALKETRFAPYWERYMDVVRAKKKPRLNAVALTEYRWMLEEYRISIFAQELGTAVPVSPKRLDRKWLEAEDV